METGKKRIHIVPSTHWDREWYIPFRRYQLRLVRLMEKVMKLTQNPSYPGFLLDGQSIMLEDYLEIKPEDKNRLKELIEKGRIIPGPWYTVPDMMIPCGESLIKNLQIGQKVCQEMGGGLFVGYSPDSFGLVSQMPQIYCLFGYDYAMYSRAQRLEDGGTNHAEVMWEAPDGSRVKALYEQYSAGVSLTIPTVWRSYDRLEMSEEHLKAAFQAVMDYQDSRYSGNVRLLVVGIDHLEPRQNLVRNIQVLQESFPEYDILLSDMESFFEELGQEEDSIFSAARGEQRGIYKEHYGLGNTLSTRMDIKMLNRETENRLLYLCQPLHAFNAYKEDFEYLDTKPYTEAAWKQLIASHAHDSICGCNCDETNRDVEHRITQAGEMAREVEKLEENFLGAFVGKGPSDAAILVYNPLPFARSGRVCGALAVCCQAPGDCLTDENGNPVKDAVIRRTFLKRRDIETMKKDEYQEILEDTTRYAVEPMTKGDYYTGLEYDFYAEDIPACGYRTYYLTEGETNAKSNLNPTDGRIENDALAVSANPDGTLDVLLKKTGKTYKGLHWFEDESDEGDSYTFSPKGDITDTRNSRAAVTAQRDLHGSSMKIDWEYEKNGAPVKISTKITLEDHSDVLSFQTTIHNEADNHRIRAVFDIDEPYTKSCSDTAFDLVERPIYQASDLARENIMTMPMRNLAFLEGSVSAAVFSLSSQEYEAVGNKEHTRFALTLLRSVDKVYRTKCLTKDESSCGEGVRWFTKDSLMHGSFTMKYALKFYPQPVSRTDLVNEALDYQHPLVPFGAYATGDGKPRDSFLKIEGAVLSSVAADNKEKTKLTIRIYNPKKEETAARIGLGYLPSSVHKVNLRGEILEELEPAENICIPMRAGEIVSVGIERDGSR